MPRLRSHVLLRPAASLVRGVDGQTHDVGPGADEDGQQAVLGPTDLERVLQSGGQVGQQLREAPAQGLGDDQRRPDHGDVQEQAEEEIPCFG